MNSSAIIANRGFSLIELMIVVVIVAVLAAVAVPSYQNSVLKSNRGVGKTELLTLIARQEQYFVNNKAYATDLTDLGFPANPYFIDNSGNSLAASAGSIYQISLSAPTNSSFTAQATPQNNQTNDSSCGTLSITHRGVESASGSGDCW
ncbi:type IV pilus assembly protein PilE [Alteromonadaceae bacterium 2753L.S.0a.02]|nr:type IV pilus assembly protein PilE [Alteromonadaceae bacterium 2753L.S.0a.02]